MTSEDWLQAQYSVLGSVLIEPSLAPKMIHQTRSTDFSGPGQTVYNAICEVFESGKPVDPVSVGAVLGAEYRPLLIQIMEIVPTAANIDHYIHICREQAKVLQIRRIGAQLTSAENSDAVRKLLDDASGLMVDKTSLRIVSMADALKSFMTRHTGEVKYLSWPIRELGEYLFAEPGDFILLGGFPSTGKSALGIQCAVHWARDKKVGFFSLETSPEKLFDRQMSSMAELSMYDIKRNTLSEEQWAKIASMSTEITATNLDLVPAAGMTPADIRSVTTMKGYDIIVIDYVQLLNSSGVNRTEQVTNISLALHRMAQDMKVTIVALSQLKRKGDDSAPENSDLRESGQLEQDADIIMMLKLEKKDQRGGNRELHVTKNKEGECFKTLLAWDGKHQTFSKAVRTGETIGLLKSMARAARREAREAENDSSQMSILPPSTPVPEQWKDEN